MRIIVTNKFQDKKFKSVDHRNAKREEDLKLTNGLVEGYPYEGAIQTTNYGKTY